MVQGGGKKLRPTGQKIRARGVKRSIYLFLRKKKEGRSFFAGSPSGSTQKSAEERKEELTEGSRREGGGKKGSVRLKGRGL